MGDIVLTPFCEYSFYAYHYFTDEEKRSVDCFLIMINSFLQR